MTLEMMNEGDMIILQKRSFYKKCRLLKSRTYSFGKKGDGQFILNLDNAFEQPFGSTFKMIREKNRTFSLQKLDKSTLTIEISTQSGHDNRHLKDDGQSQKLTKGDILKLMHSGASGQEVIQSLTENSSTFHDKTKYSQEKWVNKKQKKYEDMVTLHRPTIRLMAKMYYTQDPLKIANLRVDSLSQILSYANVQSGGRFAVFESGTLGLITAAMLHRMGDSGQLVHIYQGQQPQRETLDTMNFNQKELLTLSFININKLPKKSESINITEDIPESESTKKSSEDSKSTNEDISVIVKTEDVTNCHKIEPQNENVLKNEDISVIVKTEDVTNCDKIEPQDENVCQDKKNDLKRKYKFVRRRDEDIAVSTSVLLKGVAGFVVACRQHSANFTLELLKYLIPGHPFIVFSPYKEVLLDMYDDLQLAGGVNIRLCETWLRHYQILSNRTHPDNNMSGGGGYILYGQKVIK